MENQFQQHPNFVETGTRGFMTFWRFKFPNGYGADVIYGYGSYGYSEGLYELAVMDKDWKICYDTDITDDVLGYLSEDDVLGLLKEIEALPAKQN